MSRISIPAFKIAPQGAVVADRWYILHRDEAVPLVEELASFDPSSMLCLRRTVRFDQHQVRASCGLSSDDRIGVVALWHSRLTSLKGAGGVVEPADAQREVELEVSLDLAGGDVGGRLLLRTVVILTRGSGQAPPLVARAPGSILWEADHPPVHVDLEGSGTRFPMELRAFGNGNAFPPRAAWFLDWDRGDLTLPVLGSLRLYLNADHPLMAAVASGEPDPELDRIRQALNFDVARQIVTGAFANRDFLLDPDGFPPESVGATVRALCRGVLFPYSTLEEVSSRARREPARFEADLQAAVSLFWDSAG